MMDNGKRRPRRQLSPEEKWEVFLEVTSQEISQADAARKYGVDVSRDRPAAGVGEGRRARGVRVGEAGSAGVGGGGRAGVVAGGERPALGGVEGDGDRADVAPGKAALGLFGPVPARVSAGTKLELLGLIDEAVARRLGARAGVPGARPRRRPRAPLAAAIPGDRHPGGP